MVEVNYGALFVVLLVWLLVPFATTTTAEWFYEDSTLNQSLTWDELVTVADTAQAQSGGVGGCLFDIENWVAWRNLNECLSLSTAFVVLDLYSGENVTETMGFLAVQTIPIADDWFDWVIEPLYNYYTRFKSSMNLLTGTFGIPESVVTMFMFAWWMLPLLFVVLILIEMLKAVGAVMPFT